VLGADWIGLRTADNEPLRRSISRGAKHAAPLVVSRGRASAVRSRIYLANRSRYFDRNFATFGAITAAQYG
jgi:hypothetical protein